MEPSPTAEATRLTLLERTSPTAKTPGTLVVVGAGPHRLAIDFDDFSRLAHPPADVHRAAPGTGSERGVVLDIEEKSS